MTIYQPNPLYLKTNLSNIRKSKNLNNIGATFTFRDSMEIFLLGKNGKKYFNKSTLLKLTWFVIFRIKTHNF